MSSNLNLMKQKESDTGGWLRRRVRRMAPQLYLTLICAFAPCRCHNAKSQKSRLLRDAHVFLHGIHLLSQLVYLTLQRDWLLFRCGLRFLFHKWMYDDDDRNPPNVES